MNRTNRKTDFVDENQKTRYNKMYRAIDKKNIKLTKPEWWEKSAFNENIAMQQLQILYDNCFSSFYLRKTSDKICRMFVNIVESELESYKLMKCREAYTILLSCQKN